MSSQFSMEEARGFAAQAWCDTANASKTMDTELAESFAAILQRVVSERILSSKFVQARSVMRDSFESDYGFYDVYVSNIAMLLHDRYGVKDYDVRNRAAREIMGIIFGTRV